MDRLDLGIDSGPGIECHGNTMLILVGMTDLSNYIFDCSLVTSGLANPVDKYSITEELTASDELWFLFLYVHNHMFIPPVSLGFFVVFLIHL